MPSYITPPLPPPTLYTTPSPGLQRCSHRSALTAEKPTARSPSPPPSPFPPLRAPKGGCFVPRKRAAATKETLSKDQPAVSKGVITITTHQTNTLTLLVLALLLLQQLQRRRRWCLALQLIEASRSARVTDDCRLTFPHDLRTLTLTRTFYRSIQNFLSHTVQLSYLIKTPFACI